MKSYANFLKVNCPYCNFENGVEYAFGLQLKYCDSDNGGCDTQFAVKCASSEQNETGEFRQTIKITAHKIEGVVGRVEPASAAPPAFEDFVVIAYTDGEIFTKPQIILASKLAEYRLASDELLTDNLRLYVVTKIQARLSKPETENSTQEKEN